MNKPSNQSEFETPTVTTGPLPSSRKVYTHPLPDLAVPHREIDLHPSANEPPVPVYDTSGPYTDPSVTIDVEKGLARTRRDWVLERGHVEEYEGRDVKPEDNGGASGKHLAREFPVKHRPLHQDRPVVQGRADEVDGAAVQADAGFERPPVGVEALEGGEEGRVNVEEAVVPRLDEAGAQDPHEAGEADEVGAVGVDHRVQRVLERLAGGVGAPVDEAGGDAGALGPRQGAGARRVGGGEDDPSGAASGVAGVDEGL